MDEIVDEIPDLDQIPGDEITIYMVCMEPRETIHSLTQFYLAYFTFNKKDFDKEKFKELDKVLGFFLDESRAELFLAWNLERSARQYTIVVNKLPDLSLVQDRKFLIYIGEEITALPGLYEVRKEDYEKLSSVFQDVRLATDKEVRTTAEIFSCFVPKDYEKLKSLKLPNLECLNLDQKIPVSDYLGICSMYDKASRTFRSVKQACIRIAKDDTHVRKADIIPKMEQIAPNGEEIIDNMIQFYRDILSGKDVTDLRDFNIKFSLRDKVGNKFEVEHC